MYYVLWCTCKPETVDELEVVLETYKYLRQSTSWRWFLSMLVGREQLRAAASLTA